MSTESKTCGFHAKMISALSGGPDKMGPNVKALYERFMEQEDEECIAHETQVVFLFKTAMQRDLRGLP
jgi:hypothetical protein